MKNTVSLITGASRGLGAAVAESLAVQGSHVIAAARTVGALEELYDRIAAEGGSSSLAVLDIADDDALRSLCRRTFDRWGKLDVLVHAAVFSAQLSPVSLSDDRTLKKSIDVNVFATARLIAYAEPLLRMSETGTAVFLDDENRGRKFFGVYGSTKSAQISLARSWQHETLNSRIAVLIFKPRPMATATRATFFPGEDQTALANPKDEARRLCQQLIRRRESCITR